MASDLRSRLEEFVGRPFGKPRSTSPVNEAMIRHWCLAVADRNPIYTDAEFAARSRFGGIVAPPTMIQAWTMPQPDIEHIDEVIGRPDPGPNPFAILDGAGYPAVVATNCEQEYMHYLRPGDTITATRSVESITGEKQTGLGPGWFVTVKIIYTDRSGDAVGTELFRMLKFRPAELASATEAPPPRPRPGVNEDNRFFWEGVARGELLVQRCASCRRLRHPPQPMCPHCHSLEWDAVGASGRGTVHAYIVPRHPPLPQFGPEYVVALVDLEEGVRILSNLRDVSPAAITVGMPVEVFFDEVSEGLTLPQFRPAGVRPAERPEAAVTGARRPKAATQTLRWEDVHEGDELAPLDVPITASVIVLGALASRDFMPVHHDAEAARASGAKDVFMNILTTNGLVGRFVTDWTGPEARLRRVAIKLGAPNYPGDTMTMTGRVVRKGEGKVVEAEVRGANSAGDHVTGSVLVELL